MRAGDRAHVARLPQDQRHGRAAKQARREAEAELANRCAEEGEPLARGLAGHEHTTGERRDGRGDQPDDEPVGPQGRARGQRRGEQAHRPHGHARRPRHRHSSRGLHGGADVAQRRRGM